MGIHRMLGAAIAIVAMFGASPLGAQQSISEYGSSTPPPTSATIHQEVDFNASAERVYEALLDSKQFSAFAAGSAEFSAKSAKIDRAVGGAFSLFDGHIVGRNVELIPNQRIVQAWRVVDWPAGVYSIAKFELTARGSGTHLVFDHTGFPEWSSQDSLETPAGRFLIRFEPLGAHAAEMTMTASRIVKPIDVVSDILQRELPALVDVFLDPFLLQTAEE